MNYYRKIKLDKNQTNTNPDHYQLDWKDVYELTMNRMCDADKIFFGYWSFNEFCKTNYPEWYNKSCLFKIPKSRKYKDIKGQILLQYRDMVNELSTEYYNY